MLHIPTDTHDTTEIAVEDYIELGRLVVEWAMDPASRPRDVPALTKQLADIALLPGRVRTIEFVQGTPEHLVIPLPARAVIAAVLDRMSDPMGNPRYQVPQFYADHCRPGFGPVMTPLDTLLARMGDQTIAQCR